MKHIAIIRSYRAVSYTHLIIRTKILPYFGKLKISEISTKEISTWQNEMLAYRDEKKKPYSQTLSLIHI